MTADPLTPFRGIWPAMATPLDERLDIDHARFTAHALALLAQGCGGVTPFGTTGEGPSFGVDERRRAVDALIDGGVPASQILVSTSCAALPETVALTRHALQVGAHGCLMLPPFYLKGVPDQGIIDAYRYVIDSVADARLRLYLYDIPQVIGLNLSQHVIHTLRRLYPRTIVGIKDSAGDLAHSLALADAFMPRLMVYVGNELDLRELGRRGSTGAISGLANFMPRRVLRLVSQPDSTGADADLERTRQVLARLNAHALIPAIKGLMAGVTQEPAWLRVRPPLVALTTGEMHTLMARIADLGIDPEINPSR
jgi:4-hydroxy-tetrahydrodipicolinate synthase